MEKFVVDSFVIGKIVVFIGMLECMIWVEVKVSVEVFGVKVVGLVSKKIDYLVVGFGVGFKVKKVEELGIMILIEDEWFDLIGL